MKALVATIKTSSEPALNFLKSTEGCGAERLTFRNIPNRGVVYGLQAIYEGAKDFDAIVFMHDDVLIHHNNWAMKIADIFFTHPDAVVVGLGGATGLGTSDIYKSPYRINQLQRIDYASNQRDWEIHGKRETGTRQVAVVDGFFMAIRKSFLDQIGGWRDFKHNFHMYDAWVCLQAARLGKQVWMVGVDCTHFGGGTSITPEYMEWCKEHGTTSEREHQEPHVTIYNEFRDVLPLRVGE